MNGVLCEEFPWTQASCPEASGWRLWVGAYTASSYDGLASFPPAWALSCLLPPGHPVFILFLLGLSLCPCFSPAIFHCPVCFFCSAVPWKHAVAASSHSFVCRAWAPCLGARVGGEKERREGTSGGERLQPGSLRSAFHTWMFMQTDPLCFSFS